MKAEFGEPFLRPRPYVRLFPPLSVFRNFYVRRTLIKGDGVITAPTIMFVAAIDKLLEKIDSKLLKRVRSGRFPNWCLLLIGSLIYRPASIWKPDPVSASGQQHGTVYWKTGAGEILKNLNPEKCLQLGVHEPARPCSPTLWSQTIVEIGPSKVYLLSARSGP